MRNRLKAIRDPETLMQQKRVEVRQRLHSLISIHGITLTKLIEKYCRRFVVKNQKELFFSISRQLDLAFKLVMPELKWLTENHDSIIFDKERGVYRRLTLSGDLITLADYCDSSCEFDYA